MSCVMVLHYSFPSQTFLALVTYAFRHHILHIFTHEAVIYDLAVKIMPVVALSLFSDGINTVMASVLRGAGRQGIGASLNVIAYWIIGVPLAAALGFTYKLGVYGFWVGLLAASALQAIVQTVVISRFDWENEVKRAHKLVSSHSDMFLDDLAGGDEDTDREDVPLLGERDSRQQSAPSVFQRPTIPNATSMVQKRVVHASDSEDAISPQAAAGITSLLPTNSKSQFAAINGPDSV